MVQLNFDAVNTLPWPLRYILAISFVALATAVRYAILPIDTGVQFAFFYPAVMLAFCFCGTGAGIASVILSTLSAFYFFFPPYFSMEPTTESIHSSSVFVITASICGYFVILVNYYRKSLNEAELAVVIAGWNRASDDLTLAVDGARLGTWSLDPNNDLLFISDRFAEHFGLPIGVHAVSYRKILDIIHPLDRANVDNARAKALAEKHDFIAEHRAVWPDGSVHWIYGHGRPTYHTDGTLKRVDGISVDVTDQRIAEDNLISSAATIRAAFENMQESILIGDAKGNLIDANEAAVTFLRFNATDELPKTYQEYMSLLELSTLEGLVLNEDDNPYSLALQGQHNSLVLKIRRRDTNEEWYGRISYSPIRKRNEIIGAAITGLDISDRIQIQKHLEEVVAERTAELQATNLKLVEISRHDILTGLYNRLASDEELSSEFSRMKRTGIAYSVLAIDIDFFKSVNDSHGHAVGDEVLKLIAETLSKNLRECDFISRWGGEEFLALLPNTGLQQALIAAEKLRSAVEALDHPVAGRITISIGVAIAAFDDVNAEVATLKADEGLYEAKETGRNRVVAKKSFSKAPLYLVRSK